MAVDLSLIFLAAVFAAMGFWSGMARQWLGVVGLAAAWFGAKPLASVLAPSVAFAMEMRPSEGKAVADAVLVAGAYGFLRLLGFTSTWWLRGPPGPRDGVSRLFGAVLGAVQAAGLATLLLLAFMPSPAALLFLERWGKVPLSESRVVSGLRTEVLESPRLMGWTGGSARTTAVPAPEKTVPVGKPEAEEPPTMARPKTFLDRAHKAQEQLDAHNRELVKELDRKSL